MAEENAPLPSLPEAFWSHLQRSIDAEGLGLMHAYIQVDKSKAKTPNHAQLKGIKEVGLIAVAFDHGFSPPQILQMIHLYIEQFGAVEVVFGMDTYVKDGQPNEFKDFIAVYHWTYETDAWKYGVVDYQITPEVIVRPIRWDNTFWWNRLSSYHRSWVARERDILRGMKLRHADGTSENAVRGLHNL